jgi:hypothetical protein
MERRSQLLLCRICAAAELFVHVRAINQLQSHQTQMLVAAFDMIIEGFCVLLLYY